MEGAVPLPVELLEDYDSSGEEGSPGSPGLLTVADVKNKGLRASDLPKPRLGRELRALGEGQGWRICPGASECWGHLPFPANDEGRDS